MDSLFEKPQQNTAIFQETDDGSHTLFVPQINESYHSTHGAIQESSWIFIEQGFKICTKQTIHILEIGFGTGLNAFLTAIQAEKSKKKIHYTALEQYPITEAQAVKLNYPDKLNESRDLFEKLHQAKWGEDKQIHPTFCLHKINTDFTTAQLKVNYDLIYFDAFSPEKQPEMWTEEGFQKIIEHSNPGAILTTYCAKGSVRRTLQQVGFKVERIPGPPGKREILRATKN